MRYVKPERGAIFESLQHDIETLEIVFNMMDSKPSWPCTYADLMAIDIMVMATFARADNI